jgi:hypothetical protein
MRKSVVMSKHTSDKPKSDDDRVAFATFTQNLSQTPRSAVSRPAVKRGSLKGWPTLIVSSLIIGACATAGALVAHGHGWGEGLKIAAAAIIGGPFGACAAMVAAMLLALRVSNRSLNDMAETGTYNDMPSFLVPVVWTAGYAGAVGGSALFAGVAVHLATSSPDTQFLFRPPAVGGAIGAVLCALVVGGIAMIKVAQAPRKHDRIQER